MNVPITSEFRRSLSEPFGVNLILLMGEPKLVQIGIDKTGDAPKFIGNEGVNVVVKFNHLDPGQQEEGNRPTQIGLAHELVHAYHFVEGICARSPTQGTSGDTGGAEEEMRTVGAGGYDGEVPSENWIRDEWGLKDRTSYSGNDFSGTTATLFM